MREKVNTIRISITPPISAKTRKTDLAVLVYV